MTLHHPAAAAVTDLLWQRDVLPDFRRPDGIRLGLSPLSTAETEVEAGIDAIATALAEVATRPDAPRG